MQEARGTRRGGGPRHGGRGLLTGHARPRPGPRTIGGTFPQPGPGVGAAEARAARRFLPPAAPVSRREDVRETIRPHHAHRPSRGSAPAPPVSHRSPVPAGSALNPVLTSPLSRALLALGLVVALGCVFHAEGAFFAAQTHRDLLSASSVTGILALGMTLVILGGGIDLSVGSLLAVCGMTFAALTLGAGLAWPLGAAGALVAGVALGGVNGMLAARLRLQPFVATLATMVLARGLAKVLPVTLGQDPSSKVMPPAEQILGPPFYQWLDGDLLVLPLAGGIGVPALGVLFLGLALVLGVVVSRTVYGRHVLAVGGNEVASHLAGVAVVRVRALTYVLCGACAAVAGICQTVRDRLGNPEAGTMFELKAIAAVVIGGTSLRGGSGGIGLTVVGVLTLGYIEKILSINGVAEHWRLILQGAILVAAVLLQDRR